MVRLAVNGKATRLPDEAVGSYMLDVFGRSQRDTPCECERSYAAFEAFQALIHEQEARILEFERRPIA